MKNSYKLLLLVFIFISSSQHVFSQCAGADSLTYSFTDPSGSGVFSGFLCVGTDSVGTNGFNGYYSGDGFRVNLVGGSHVLFSVDNCGNHDVSLTVNDSLHQIIPGAYAPPACPNSLIFTVPYTGSFIIVLNENGVCNVSGSTVIGQAYAQLEPGSTVPACPDAFVDNDTICGAVPLYIDSPFVHGNSSLASLNDPMDSYIQSIGDSCSPPNNTLWYSFTSSVNIDTMNIWITSDAGSHFHSWLIGFVAQQPGTPCTGPLSLLGCLPGPDDNSGVDTASHTVFGFIAGQVYYFMIDGFSGGTGGFSIALRSFPYLNTVVEMEGMNDISVYPNPASGKITIRNTKRETGKGTISLMSCYGYEVFNDRFNTLTDKEIDLANVQSGIYNLSITTLKGTIRKKIIIAK